uniref:Signal recognition particle 19 kDa protein n=1 Tax=Phallusia mammillata TaxID=59560 RepID=A0A6F9DTR8_9ASCI|nr:signal recognition particle 19 kDa protein-like [Phallusia mammillata]
MASTSQICVDKHLCIYPAYLNSKKTLANGRRVPKEKGCENPTCNEIKDVCASAGLKPIVENKLYPRELYRGDALYRGRIRVMLKNPDGSLVNDMIPDKKSLLLYLGSMIPKLKTRTQKGASGDNVSGQSQSKSKKGQKKRR